MTQYRQLAAILFTGIVGSTAIMQRDEQTAVSINKRYVAVLKKSVSVYGGEILNDYGDGSLCTFSSATQRGEMCHRNVAAIAIRAKSSSSYRFACRRNFF